MKVYCERCDYCHEPPNGFPLEVGCRAKIRLILDTRYHSLRPPSRWLLLEANCYELNKNNDCGYFTPRRPWWRRLFKRWPEPKVVERVTQQ